ncbi:pur operon repressor [Caldisalinibacter kiritimatiensis]|uniref:Pur operon repressor n=1 Tax=Caldisalinibacter kiritimatiensis TaxID=1304284 RepID=R1CUJ2_9FIRM|nr:pur operon repressor [Caldisalinibacter kiritimatiensis]EOD00339.1 Pur operon repressor [Caldisalinibacter kiritimatiensis]
MRKLRRNHRIGALMNILTERPNHIFTYNYFTERFNAAKSTISEDIVIAKELVEELDLGCIETISGAAGGVKFVPKMSKERTKEFLVELSDKFKEKDRLLTGGFIYMTDILYSPNIANCIGKVFASKFLTEEIDYVVTVETKGIPISMMTAQALDVPLVIIRRNARVTEGPTVSINYVTGSTKKIQTMSLSRRAIKEGSKVLVVDDFMKAGGTAKGIQDMMKEFKADVAGIGVLIATEEPKKKLVDNYISLLTLKGIDEEKQEIYIEPNLDILEG